jgi:lysophospholipase L1-like esterase
LNPVRIVAFGSSSVRGRGDPEGGGFVGRLERWYQTQVPNSSVINLGRVGDSTAKMLGRIENDVSPLSPDLIILYPGLNDTRRKSLSSPTASTAEEFKLNVSTLIQKASAIAPTLFISAFPIDETRTCPWTDSNLFYLQSDAARFTEIGSKVCKDAGIPYLPIFETWSQFSNISELSLDGLHGTPEAHERLATELRAHISDMIAW